MGISSENETAGSVRAAGSNDASAGIARAKQIIAGLKNALHPERGTEPPQIFETHISLVLLCGDRAYKVKKPVDLGFLDYSKLEARHHYCMEEVRLNSRLSPEVYLSRGLPGFARRSA